MEIDLKKEEITIDRVKKLIASKDDTEHRQIRVTKEGILFLSDEVGNDNLENILFRLESFQEGNDYVGEKAANDKKWVRRVTKAIQDNWPKPSSSYIDWF